LIGLALWGIGVQVNETLSTLGLAATALGAVIHWARRGKAAEAAPALRAWAALAVFLAWALAVPALAGHSPTWTGAARVLDWLGIPVAAYALRVLEPKSRTALAAICGATFLLSCAVAALQHFGVWPSPRAFEWWSWTRIPFGRVYEKVPQADGRFMAGGLLFHRLKFAHVGGLAVLAACVLGLAGRGALRALGLVCTAVGFISVLEFPYARTASVALLLSLCVALILSLKGRRAALPTLAIATLAVVSILAYRPTRERFLVGLTPAGGGYRSEILSTGLRAVAEHPLAGAGLGRFRPSYFGSPETHPQVIENPGKAHNQFLSIAAELGIPGLLLFLLFLGRMARSFSPSEPLGVLGISCLVFFALVSLAHDPLIHPPFSMALALCMGAASARAPMSLR
jgi:O-antigen ligase